MLLLLSLSLFCCYCFAVVDVKQQQSLRLIDSCCCFFAASIFAVAAIAAVAVAVFADVAFDQ